MYRFGASPAYIKRQFPKASDSFGEPLAISADGSTIAASATFADSAGTDAGSITILYFGQ